MTSGFDALSLALFTSLTPVGVVAFIAVAIARLSAPDSSVAVRIDRTVALPFAIVLFGFIASATHLGTPANALHVFSGVGRSPLSNEVFSAVLFLFLVGAYWMMAFKQDFPDKLAKPWLVLACIAGVGLITFTSQAYAVSTVPTWDTAFTPANLVFCALLAGPIVGLLILERTPATPRGLEIALLIIASIALIVGTTVLFFHHASLDSIANNEFSAPLLVPNYLATIFTHAVLGTFSVIIAGISLRQQQNKRVKFTLRAGASILALLAVFITRVTFYNLHMTVGF